MTQPWAAITAYLVASLCTAACWSVVSAYFSGRLGLSEVFNVWLMLSLLVTAFAALPATAVRCIAVLLNQTSFLATTLSGALVGTAMFWLVFGSTWASGNSPSSILPFLTYGGALGAVGGAVFSFLETRLLKRDDNE